MRSFFLLVWPILCAIIFLLVWVASPPLWEFRNGDAVDVDRTGEVFVSTTT